MKTGKKKVLAIIKKSNFNPTVFCHIVIFYIEGRTVCQTG